MGLETATYINQLNVNNPDDVTDYVSGGDDHIRLLKRTIQQTFPYVTGPIVANQDDLTKTKYLVDSGTTNQVIVSPAIAWSSYDAGKGFIVKIAATNTGSTTAKVSALSPVTILDSTGAALQDGTLIAGSIHSLIYDGTNFRLQDSNGVFTNTNLKITSANSVNASIANTKTGTLSLGTNGHSNILLNADGSLNLGAVSLTVPLLTEWAAGNFPMSGTISAGSFSTTGSYTTTGGNLTIKTTSPVINMRDTDNRSAIISVDEGKFRIKNTTGNDSETAQMPSSGFWGIDHDIDLGKTTFGNDITVKGDVISHRLSNSQHGRVVLGNAGTKYLEYNNISYAMPGAELEVNGYQVLKKAHISYSANYYVPRFVGDFHGLNIMPTWAGNLLTTTPTCTRNSTGNYTMQFPGISSIYSINILGADVNSKALISITNITGNAVTFTVHNTGGNLLNPDIGVFVQVYGA